MTNLTGANFGPYRLIAPLGEGGLAMVYKAYQPGLDRLVVVKVLSDYWLRDKTFLSRFQTEAEILARLEHPNLLPLYDFGREERLAYLVTRFVAGESLAHWLGRPLPFEQVGQWLGQVAAALDYIHQQGILHRDIKPANILIERGETALLNDIGLAAIMAGGQFTAPGVGLGTPAYMSPEQGEGQLIDARSDIYSLGVVLYELVTGRVPFKADTPLAVVIKHITAPLPLPRTLNPTIPESAEQVILKALAKNKADRYPSAGTMMDAFKRAIATEPKAALPAKEPPPQLGLLCSNCYHFNRPGVNYCEQCASLLGQTGLTCPRCNQINRAGVNYCEQCAQLLTAPGPTCPRCRYANRSHVSFCEGCGAWLESRAVSPHSG